MAKNNKGKKTKKKPNTTGSSSVQMKKVIVSENTSTETSAPLPHDNTIVSISEREVGGGKGPTDNNKQKIEEPNRIPGYIFMCNPSTKIECYRYRVFGLPMGKKDVVERIKPGAKLFLYDFELKLLYGVYEATCPGKLHLEPSAFKGKFPAQVKFKIFKECLPMPEVFLRNVIRENYTGSKFNQELSRNLAKKLTSAFRPLTSPGTQPLPQSLTLQPRLENHYNPTLAFPPRNIPYIPTLQYEQIPSVIQRQPIQSLPQHTHHRASSYLEHSTPSSSYYAVPNPPQQPSTTAHVLPPYSRPVEDTSHHLHQISDLERKYLQMPLLGGSQQYAPSSSLHSGIPYQESVVPYDPSSSGLAVEGSSVPQFAHHHHQHYEMAYSATQPMQSDYANAYYSYSHHAYVQQPPTQALAPPDVEPQAGGPPSRIFIRTPGNDSCSESGRLCVIV